ncbi:hypothetical protein ACH4OQ_37170 [Streptomyces luteogriseus]|uniref:hypothetical protein n=1 Tax=Streptomyces luteogriseus TaxID=68233 RepID=UPI0037872E9D
MDDHDVDEVPQKALDRLTLPAEATSALWSTPDVDEGVGGAGALLLTGTTTPVTAGPEPSSSPATPGRPVAG